MSDRAPATERLYYTDAALLRFTARVVALADDGRRVLLDRTAFYPTSGGQPHDLGTLAGVPVVDVIDEEAHVAHLLAAPLPAAVGDAVDGAIDAARRLDHRQQHTGQHLLSALAADRFGWETASVHFGDRLSTIDFATERAAREALLELETLANAAVAENRAVTVGFEEAATAAGLRKPSGRTGTIRVVMIDGLDRSACGGTHVDATGAIGAVLLRRVERVKQGTRVEFVCGLRAARRARADWDALDSVAQALSTAPDDVPAAVRAQREATRAALARAERLAERVAAHEARATWDATPPGADGLRRIALAAGPDDTLEALTPLVRALVELPGVLVVAHAARPQPAVLLAASADAGVDAAARLRAVLAPLGGRGGGSARMAQGRVPDAGVLASVVAASLATPDA